MSVRTFARCLGAALALGVMVVAIAACGGGESSGGSGGEGSGSSSESGPIKIGGIVSETGPLAFPEDAEGAEAAFDEINEKGGINGRKVEYMVKDDAGEPSTVAQVAQQLVNEDGVVGMAGNMSAGTDCTTNGPLYARTGTYGVGMALQPECSESETFAPVNAGPVASDSLMMIYGGKGLKSKTNCFFGTSTGGSAAIYEVARPIVEGAGVKLDYFAPTQGENDAATSYVVKAKSQGCDALSYSGDPAQNLATLKAEQAQGYEGARLFSSAAYSLDLAKEAGSAMEGMYATSEFAPFTGNEPAVKQMRAAFEKNNVPITFFSEGGYVAAKVFAGVLEQIEGPITRESVAAQMKKKEPVDTPLLAKPWVFGHHPNLSVHMVQYKNGEFVPVGEYISLTEKQITGE